MRLFQVDKSTNLVVECHLKVILFLLNSPKCALVEFEKAMFHGLPSHFELTYGLLTIPKYNLVQVEKALFQGLAWHFQLIFGLWTSSK